MKKLTSILSVILLMSSTTAFAGWNTVRTNSKTYVKHQKAMGREFVKHKRDQIYETNKMIAQAQKQIAAHRDYKTCVGRAKSISHMNTCNNRWSRRVNSIR